MTEDIDQDRRLGFEFDGRSGRLDDCVTDDKAYNLASPRLVRAYAAARSARFEFGQSGAFHAA